ncbi:MAG: primosomal protein N' [Clostridia bacterium]|nr:primosomal protein N' [Clostridia bacterium]
MYAKVIIDISHENIDRLFTYRLTVKAAVGQRVLVPFGKGNRLTEGFILDITETAPDLQGHELKNIIKVCEDYAVLDREQIMLAEWIRETYHCTLAQSLRLMIPAQMRGMRISEKKLRAVKIKDGVDADEYLRSLRTKNGKIRSQGAYDTVEFLMQTDNAVLVSDITEIIPTCSSAVVKRLIDLGILEVSMQTVYRRPQTVKKTSGKKPELTKEQKTVLEQILSEEKGTFLIHGVTGSGKTEVYMSVIEDLVSKGKGAIVLVPEISLTPQTVARFTGRFGKRVAVLHSRLSAGERFDEWRRIRVGEVDVVVGARSGVFAPVHDLGAIIIDEEHENAYASEKNPRYNAVEVAQKRCKIASAKLILGSATPSVTTYFRAKLGKYKLLEMKERVNALPLPAVETVDMRAEFVSGNNSIFSRRLVEKLKKCIENGEQAILFLNRRGFSSAVSCRNCGYVWKCDSCDVSMTYHKFDRKMKCHYCGEEADIPKLCPSCKKAYIKYVGIGTQQIEEEIKKILPQVSCIRMDADTTKKKDAHMNILSEFASGKAQILIGTQMIAKGLDFPNVTLVCAVSVDAMLAMPDFRGYERTFELLTQVAGRAGRAGKEGSVILQTNIPDHPVLTFAQNHDYKGFYEYTIKNRLENMYPPYSVFVRVLFSSEAEETAHTESVRFANSVYERMCSLLSAKGADLNEILYIYAMPAPIKRIQNKHRRHVLIKLARTKNTHELINTVYDYDKDVFDSEISVEINPNDML